MVIVEGIYSMEGELCKLPEIIAICKKYKVGYYGSSNIIYKLYFFNLYLFSMCFFDFLFYMGLVFNLEFKIRFAEVYTEKATCIISEWNILNYLFLETLYSIHLFGEFKIHWSKMSFLDEKIKRKLKFRNF